MMKKLATTIFIIGLFYGFCVASNDQYERAVSEPAWLQQEIAKADAEAAENFRRGK